MTVTQPQPLQPLQPLQPSSPEPARETFTLDFTSRRALSLTPVGSPCTNVCRLDVVSRTYCVGCHRTRAEIKAWKTLNDDEKRAIIHSLPDRAALNGTA